MRYIQILSLLFAIFLSANAQNDSIISINKFEYDINYGISKSHKFCSEQKIYNKIGNLMRENRYSQMNDGSKKVSLDLYINYYYKDEMPYTEEAFSTDGNLVYIKYYKYKNGAIQKEIYLSLDNNQLVQKDSVILYKYKKGELYSYIKLVGKKTKYSISTIEQNDQNRIVTTTHLISAKNADDITKTIIKSDLENNVVLSETISTSFHGKPDDILSIKYNYEDGNPNCASKDYSRNNEVFQTIKYKYDKKGRIITKLVSDGSGKMTGYTSYDEMKLIINFRNYSSVLDKNIDLYSKNLK